LAGVDIVAGNNTCTPEATVGAVLMLEADLVAGTAGVPACVDADTLSEAQLDTGTKAAGIETGRELGTLSVTVAGASEVPLGTALDAEAGWEPMAELRMADAEAGAEAVVVLAGEAGVPAGIEKSSARGVEASVGTCTPDCRKGAAPGTNTDTVAGAATVPAGTLSDTNPGVELVNETNTAGTDAETDAGKDAVTESGASDVPAGTERESDAGIELDSETLAAKPEAGCEAVSDAVAVAGAAGVPAGIGTTMEAGADSSVEISHAELEPNAGVDADAVAGCSGVPAGTLCDLEAVWEAATETCTAEAHDGADAGTVPGVPGAVAGTVPGKTTCAPEATDGTVRMLEAEALAGAASVPAGTDQDALAGAQLDTGTNAAGIEAGRDPGALSEAVTGKVSVPPGTVLDPEAGREPLAELRIADTDAGAEAVLVLAGEAGVPAGTHDGSPMGAEANVGT
jgi:hypothetical protein